MNGSLIKDEISVEEIESPRIDTNFVKDSPIKFTLSPLYNSFNGSGESADLASLSIQETTSVSNQVFRPIRRRRKYRVEPIDGLRAAEQWGLDYRGKLLRRAVITNNILTVQELLSANSNCINNRGDCDLTALHLAVQYGRNHIVEILLNYDADPNLVDSFHLTPLFLAVMKEYPVCVRILISHGALVHICDPSHWITNLLDRDYESLSGARIEILYEMQVEVNNKKLREEMSNLNSLMGELKVFCPFTKANLELESLQNRLDSVHILKTNDVT